MVTVKTAITLLVALLLVGCGGSESNEKASPSGEKTGKGSAVESADMAVVEEKESGLDAAYVAGNRAYGVGGGSGGEKLAAAVNTTLMSTLAPAAIRSPVDSSFIAYNSWRERRPVIRIHDTTTNADSILDEGAFSLAWRRDGALGYFKGLQPDVGTPKRYLGHVVVRRSRQAAPVRWTEKPGRYIVAAWAGERLVVYRLSEEWPELLVLDGPGRTRVLAESSGLVALSPDGRRAFVTRYGASPPVVRILDIATGEEVATFTFSKETGEPLTWVTESGSWVGDLVAAPATQGVVILRVDSGEIVLDQVLRLDPDFFPLGAFEPRLDDAGRKLVVWAELVSQPRQAIPPAAVLICDRVDHQCVQGPQASSFPGPRIIYNPSRP
jgi:hypothetical protein